MASAARFPFRIPVEIESRIFSLVDELSISLVSKSFSEANNRAIRVVWRETFPLLRELMAILFQPTETLLSILPQQTEGLSPRDFAYLYPLLKKKVLRAPLQILNPPMFLRLPAERQEAMLVTLRTDRQTRVQQLDATYSGNSFHPNRLLRLLHILIPRIPRNATSIASHLQWVGSKPVIQLRAYIDASSSQEQKSHS